MIAFIIVIALLGAFGSNGPLTSDNATLFRDPGKILDVHAAVVGERGCSSCHAPHDMDPRGFVLAVFRPSGPSQGGSNKCLACHVIAKKPGSGHSAEACTLCHAEHKGAVAPVSKITDQQCHTCHKTKFTTFSASHPEFKKTYPYVRRTAINFDHVKHLETHFKDQRFADKAPKDRCIGCHVASKASWRVPIKPFQETCAGCHEEQIGKRELTLFTFPELKKNPADPKTIADSCPGGAPKKADEYESASLEPLNPVAAALLGVDGGDISSYEGHVGALLEGMLTEGNAPISELLSKADGQPAHLLSGLAPGLLHSAACSWAANREHEAPGEPEFGGWHAGEFFLRYRALRHQDPVIKAWLDFAAAAKPTPSGSSGDRRRPKGGRFTPTRTCPISTCWVRVRSARRATPWTRRPTTPPPSSRPIPRCSTATSQRLARNCARPVINRARSSKTALPVTSITTRPGSRTE